MTTTRKTKNKSVSNVLPGTLFVVATPIGNSQDWTDRAKKTLSTVAVVAAEDTRVLKRELAKVGVNPKKVFSHHEHNEETSTKGILEVLMGGEDVALASDAGTPLISDPGYKLVATARAQGIKIVPIPGASSVTAALSVAALGGKTFFFGGFLSSHTDARRKELKRSRRLAEIVIFFEAPHRLRETLADAEEIFGPQTPTVVCRELTKPYEEIQFTSLIDMKKHYQVNEPRGEFVILFKGNPTDQLDSTDTEKEVIRLINLGRSASDILDELQPVTELTRKQLYDLVLRYKKTV